MDCPYRSVCYYPLNSTTTTISSYRLASWTDIQQCACETYYNFGGLKCDTPTPYIIGCAIPSLITSIISFSCVGILTWDLISCLVNKVKLQWNALFATYIALYFGVSALFIENFTITISLFGGVFYVGDDGLKYVNQVMVLSVCLVIAFFFCTVAALQVSLVWIDVAQRANNMSSRTNANVFRYKWALAIYEVIIIIVAIYGIVIKDIFAVVIVLIPAEVFIVLTYTYGAYKMGKVIQEAQTNQTNLQEQSNSKLKQTLKEIQYTAILLSLTILFVFILAGPYFAVNGLNAYSEPGQPSPGMLWGNLLWVPLSLSCSVIGNYIHLSLQKKIMTVQQKNITTSNKVVANVVADEEKNKIQTGNSTSDGN
jgi:hypothetical protein